MRPAGSSPLSSEIAVRYQIGSALNFLHRPISQHIPTVADGQHILVLMVGKDDALCSRLVAKVRYHFFYQYRRQIRKWLIQQGEGTASVQYDDDLYQLPHSARQRSEALVGVRSNVFKL